MTAVFGIAGTVRISSPALRGSMELCSSTTSEVKTAKELTVTSSAILRCFRFACRRRALEKNYCEEIRTSNAKQSYHVTNYSHVVYLLGRHSTRGGAHGHACEHLARRRTGYKAT